MRERHAQLQNYIHSKGEVRTAELYELFPDVSHITVRRDLILLERSGLITRVHGGARVNTAQNRQTQPEDFFADRVSVMSTEKRHIAVAALTFVEERRSLFLDSGTTLMAFAQQLPDKDLSVLTAAPNIAMTVLAQKPGITVMLAGGTVNPKTLSCSGFGSAEALKLINIDIAFMSTSAFTPDSGFTVGDPFECELKHSIVQKAQRVIMLMDSSKSGKSMPYTFARAQHIDTLISTHRLDKATVEHFESKGIQVILC